ncbi:MAG: AAA family ATPase [Gemmatimonadaceae bacterium]
MASTPIASPWTPYGLSDDPFFQAPLAPSDDAARPITLFVGREEEVQLLGGQVVGSSSSRAIIQGPAGVGKTSFVNRLKVALAEQGVLTHEQPVRIRAGMSPRQFCAEVLRVLLQIRATQAPAPGLARNTAKLASKEARGEDAFWRRVGHLVEGEDTTAGGVTFGVPAANIGVQKERGRIPAEVDELSLDAELAQAVAYLSAGGKRHVLLHVDNLENLSGVDAAAAASLVQNLRDSFLTDHSHWLFVGTDNIEQWIFRTTEQVGGIIPFAVDLEPLPAEAIAEVLHRRYQHLRRGRNLTPPIEPAVAAALYERYHGDLRNFLRLLSRAVQHHAITSPGRPLGAGELVALMAPRYWPDLVKRIGEPDARHLAVIYAEKLYDAEFRVADAVQAIGTMTQPAASKLVRRLLAAGVITQSRVDGKSVYYRLRTGDLTIALGLS